MSALCSCGHTEDDHVMWCAACDHGAVYEDLDEETGELVMLTPGDCDCTDYAPAVLR
jgi:hypothetical protein